MTDLATFEQHAGKQMAIVMFWRDWGSSKSVLYPEWLGAIAARGSVPLISWSPANWESDDQSAYSLDSIIAGHHDAYVRGWAQQLAAYGGPVLLRWAHEMNASWYHWGQQPDKYVAAWRHIHEIFAAEGATNVQWVWCPNTYWDSASRFEAYFPGDQYVDWLGLDGYNNTSWGFTYWAQLFGPSYTAITALSSKPLMIVETASAEATAEQTAAGHSKARWISDAYGSAIPSMPRIKAVVWFNESKAGVETNGHDWRIESSAAAQSAFAQAVAAAVYRSTWP